MDDNTLSQAITWTAALVFLTSAWATFWIWRARRGGWSALAAAYAATARPRDTLPRRWQSAALMPGRVTYPGLITFRLTVDGLHAAAALPVRFGHEPLLVPWDDIEIFAVDTYPADRLYDLKFVRVPQLKVRVGVNAAQFIRRAADNSQYFAEQRALDARPVASRPKALARPRQSVA